MRSVDSAMDSKICVICGSPLEYVTTKIGGWHNNTYFHVYRCSSNHKYPWYCRNSECEKQFYLEEGYPTSEVEYCPRCGTDCISDAHAFAAK
jgi:rRNA maturation endonuclease Nob1